MNKNYKLKTKEDKNPGSDLSGFDGLGTFLSKEKFKLFLVLVIVLINTVMVILAPYLIGIGIDDYILDNNKNGLVNIAFLFLFVTLVAFVTNYFQIIITGGIGQRILFRIRKAIFSKLQAMPLQFFNETKSGDLISRINSDTEKMNSLFAEILIRLISGFFTVLGIFIFIIYLNWKLGMALMLVSTFILLMVYLLTPLTQRLNKEALDVTGEFSGEIKESITNFKAIIAFNKRDYFIKSVEEKNYKNYLALLKSNIVNTFTYPLLQYGNNISQLVVLLLGLYLISIGELTIGLLVSYLAYVNQLFRPMQMLANIWPQIQTAIAAWRRIMEVLILENNLSYIEKKKQLGNSDIRDENILELKNVDFEYEEGKPIIRGLNLNIKKGETIALIGPTGGGKSTTANLLRHLYDVTNGQILLKGRDIREYSEEDLSKIFGYILQEPMLFKGTVGENIAYALDFEGEYDEKVLLSKIEELGLMHLLDKFPKALKTKVSPESEDISIGQRQIIAFIRALLRKSEILILDEATANIDTITENQLDEVLNKLQESTTLIVIAHRLSTIESADEIVFISDGIAQKAMSFDDALSLIKN